MTADPWTTFLDWLVTVLVPAWGELIDLLPFFVVIGIIGPLLSIIGLMWVWYLLKRKRGHVTRTEAQAIAVPLDEDGVPEFPVNVPYCEEHALIYPPHARNCEIDRGDLSVACPVDGTVRDADVETCSACGTRFVLGAHAGPTEVSSGTGPPEGGAAVA